MAKIKHITAREILDAKGNPTVEATVVLDSDVVGIAACPSGTSMGQYEAHELRDGDESRYRGKGVLKAVKNITTILAPKLMGMDNTSQQIIDRAMLELDGTENKAKIGANAMLAVSMAAAKALAKSNRMPLYIYLNTVIQQGATKPKMPIPMFNVLNGGLHAGKNVDFQEFLVIPSSSTPYSTGLMMGWNVYHALHDVLAKNNLTTLIGDEGGFAPTLTKNEEALSLLAQSIEACGYRLGYDLFLGIDAASGTFFDTDHYKIKDRSTKLSPKDLLMFYESLIKTYHILYLEDPFAEDDWEAWTDALATIGTSAIIVGDDLTATNPLRLQTALHNKALSGIIIKPNQIGTVIEALAVVEIAREAGLKIAVSHRSGETNDDFIADFAVGVGADYVKFGAPARGERLAKYNRLSAIEAELTNSQA